MDPFGELAPYYDDWFETEQGRWMEVEEMRALRSVLPEECGGAVLEVGAGTGRVAGRLATLGFDVVAIEPSAPMRREGASRTRDLGVMWLDGCAERLPVAAGTVVGTVLFTSVEFVRDVPAAVREARRVTVRGGFLTIGFLQALSPWVALYRRQADLGEDPWAAARFFVLDDLIELIGSKPERVARAVHLAPEARPPFEEADSAGVRAGNPPALEVATWRV